MLGAIVGDVVGSVYEWSNIKTKEFELFSPRGFFTDDTVLTVALAEAILSGRPYQDLMREYYHLYPDRGYGGSFHTWARNPEAGPYHSWGNGAAMRISPAGWAFDDLEQVLAAAAGFTGLTHNHPEGIKGGQATAAAVFLARTGSSRQEIRRFVEDRFNYDLSLHVDQLRPDYVFDVSSQGTVPQALRAFLDSTDFEDAIRNAISLGGDSDTLGCITGGVAEAFYGRVPQPIAQRVLEFLDPRLLRVIREFRERFCGESL